MKTKITINKKIILGTILVTLAFISSWFAVRLTDIGAGTASLFSLGFLSLGKKVMQ